jgi:hypothetical protein
MYRHPERGEESVLYVNENILHFPYGTAYGSPGMIRLLYIFIRSF